jgi:hypothetical protein
MTRNYAQIRSLPAVRRRIAQSVAAFLFLCSAITGRAQPEAVIADSSGLPRPAAVKDSISPVSPLLVDWIGERIDFHVAFGIVPAGKARLEVLDTLRVNGQLALHAVSTARSAKSFDLVFKVRDSIETWFDADSVYALRFRKRLREGPYRDEKIVEFDLADSLVRWQDDGRDKPPLVVEPRVQDVLSAGYKARLLPMSVGDTFSIRTHDVNKTYDLMVIVHARETVETPAGVFDCFKVEPVLRSGGIFKKEKGARVFVWVTADNRRIPVQMQSKVSFGTITASMESYIPPCSQR